MMFALYCCVELFVFVRASLQTVSFIPALVHTGLNKYRIASQLTEFLLVKYDFSK